MCTLPATNIFLYPNCFSIQAQGKNWAKLVQGQACGQLIDGHSPCEQSPASLCLTTSVRLALEKPEWSPDTHKDFPLHFKLVCQELVKAVCKSDRDCEGFGKLGINECCEVITRMPYPISAWVVTNET